MNVKNELYYYLNYKPLFQNNKNIVNKKLIYSKNFFIFFLILETLFKKQTDIGDTKNNVSIKILKKNNKSITFLRAPNKYKKAQIKLELLRYEIKFTFRLILSWEIQKKFILDFIRFLFNFYLYFESTLFFLRKKKISLNFTAKNTNNLNILKL